MSTSEGLVGPGWLVEDLLRVEDLLLTTATSSSHALVTETASHVMKAGGKRLRPALVLLSSHAGRAGSLSSDQAAAAVELIHLASLYHDDVMDQTDTRRGAPTVHSKWGIEVAVLAGDYLFAQGCLLGAAAGGEIPGILSRALADVCEGQIAEDQVVGDPSRGVQEYTSTIQLKTAALFRAACEMGACTSGAPQHRRESLAAYGASLGIVFQVIDDLLDLVGDEDQIGKPLGTDLKEGVFTLPVLIGSERDPSLAELLVRGERELDVVLPRLEACGAIEAAFDLAQREADAARAAIASLGVQAEWTAALDMIVTGVMAQASSPTHAFDRG